MFQNYAVKYICDDGHKGLTLMYAASEKDALQKFNIMYGYLGKVVSVSQITHFLSITDFCEEES